MKIQIQPMKAAKDLSINSGIRGQPNGPHDPAKIAKLTIANTNEKKRAFLAILIMAIAPR